MTSHEHLRFPGRWQAFFVAGMAAYFLGAGLSDYAYWSSHQIEWSNFASWLLVGALVLGGGALVFAAAAFGRDGRRSSVAIYLGVLVLTWILGFINALVHARDAWAVMPTGLVLSLLVALLACVAAYLCFSGLRMGEAS